ncbi:hypothetical protein BKA70DRAFT_1151109 [Coprinopsis sp. MPI-PUGE-AT-0042]|nr:hypothetical protein BKA70DRAFT_1151109 [Coprinopsis sp. MPI-PUGE-AT-0042]
MLRASSFRLFSSRTLLQASKPNRMRFSLQRSNLPRLKLATSLRQMSTTGPEERKLSWDDKVNAVELSGCIPLNMVYMLAKNGEISLREMGLPVLPERVEGDPAPCLTRAEIEKYLPPLLQRGWILEWRSREASTLEDRNGSPAQVSHGVETSVNAAKGAPGEETPYLVSRYQFLTEDEGAVDDYLADIKLLSEVGEFHHYDSTSTDQISDEVVELSLRLQTHNAKKLVGDDWVPASGLTMRDIRFAFLADWVYVGHVRSQLLTQYKAVHRLTPKAVERLLS